MKSVLQFVDLVFEVVDVQVLRTDSIAGHFLAERRNIERQRTGTERQQHDRARSPHTAVASAAAEMFAVREQSY